MCGCRAGFTGKRCEANINECATNPCANGATCIDRINDYFCTCAPGYTGRNCAKPTDRCAFQRCLNGGTCRQTSDHTYEYALLPLPGRLQRTPLRRLGRASGRHPQPQAAGTP